MKNAPLLLIVALILACSDRERTNPLDPSNPITHGAPTGFRAVANRDTANLSWDPVDVDGLTGYRIYRSIGGDSLRFYDSVSANSTQFREWDLAYDSTYAYAVRALTLDGESRLTTPDTLVPGLHNFWIADYYNSRVWRITYDGAHILGQEYFTSPVGVAYQPETGRVWVADYYDQAVYYFAAGSAERQRIDLTGWPIDIVSGHGTDNVYVLQRATDEINLVGPGGTIQSTLQLPEPAHSNGTIAVDVRGGFLWFSNPSSYSLGNVYRRRLPPADGEWEHMASLAYPREIAADLLEGGCWVATDSGLVRIDSSGNRSTYYPQLEVLEVWDISLNPDPVNGDCYFVGRTSQDGRWQAGRLYGFPEPETEIILDDTYSFLADIQVLPGPDRVGFLVSQPSTGRILRFDPDGNLIGQLDGFDAYLEFALE